MRENLGFSCPSCHVLLSSVEDSLLCSVCKKEYPMKDGIGIFISHRDMQDVSFYDDWYNCPHKAYNLKNIGKVIKSSSLIKRHPVFFSYLLYTQYKRERFFRRVAKMIKRNYKNPLILDLGCGGGNTHLGDIGEVCGIDYSITSLINSYAHRNYSLLANGSVFALPFQSEMFDCVVSSDLIGHIEPEKKDRFFSEMRRVLKRGGLCAHLLETDSDNFIKRFAKKYPDLYQRYFIEGIGGHFGLEMPEIVLDRFRRKGFHILNVRKYYTYIWDIESFIALFDNEYTEKSAFLRLVLRFYSVLCKNFGVKVCATAFLGLFSFIVDIMSPINKAEGLMIICKKR